MKDRKLKKAVALSYNAKDIAPRVIAKGKGYVAKKIVQEAQNNNIPLYKDEAVIEKLYGLEVQEYIPEDLYEVVAEILLFVGYLDKHKF